MIVNTGAGRSALSDGAVRRLGLPLGDVPKVLVHGVTGSQSVPMVRVDSMTLGNLNRLSIALPVLSTAVGAADGYLSLADFVTDGILLDVQHNRIWLPHGSFRRPACPGSALLRMDPTDERVIVVAASVQGTPVKAIIDTGANATLGNLALYQALTDRVPNGMIEARRMNTSMGGSLRGPVPLPALELGSLRVMGAAIRYGSIGLLEHLGLTDVPTLLMGMDILGSFGAIDLNFELRTVRIDPPKRKGR